MPATPKPHMIVALAGCGGDEWLSVMSAVKLTCLGNLLRGMTLLGTDAGQSDSLSPPHERVWAKAMGLGTGFGVDSLADGLIPSAAYSNNAKPAEACAFITLCHWSMGREHATLTDPQTLELTEADSRTLLAAMQPYFATEGITLHYVEPTLWLAKGNVFVSLPTASLDRVLGRNVDRWLPASTALKLLQNEMQMLLYTHPVNDLRSMHGLRSVNSFWISGSGALAEPATDHSHIKVTRALAQAAFSNNWTAHAQAWIQLDAEDIAQLLARQNCGETVRISLCGESNSLTFETAQRGFFAQMKSVLRPQRPIDVLKQL